ncbi:MAG: hypothetical protein N3C63_07715 [Rhodocyclaceae bacterium]|nr:hypothetical protein [Rhodocyclaceae bacterium]
MKSFPWWRLAVAGFLCAALSARAGAEEAFHPEIGIHLLARYSQRAEEGHWAGFLPAGHAHGSRRGLSFDHSELTIGAAFAPSWRAQASFALKEGALVGEEAWLAARGADAGLAVKGGRFFAALGAHNEQHPHAWDFADQSLPHRAFIGEHYAQEGVQFAWRPLRFAGLEFVAGLGRGVHKEGRRDPVSRAWMARLGNEHAGGVTWRAGLSWLAVRADARPGHWEDDNGVETELRFAGQSRLAVADFVWQWAPEGEADDPRLKFQAEYLRRRESGTLACADNAAFGGACSAGGIADHYRARQSGWYAQGLYRFLPGWRLGFRHDRLVAGHVDFAPAFAGVLSPPASAPRRNTLLIEWGPDESRRLRLQLAREALGEAQAGHRVVLQYLHLLGSHAH